MESLEQEIIGWVNDRPMWQRAISAKIIAGENIDQSWIDSFAESVVIGEVTDVERELTVKDLPSSSSAGSRVVLKSIGHLENVNAILAGEILTFGAAGLTAIYGDNGSGKSGYARLIKEVVGARHHQDVLPNVFSSKPNQFQAAKLSYEVDGDEREGGWPALSDLDLRQIHFYDEACGDDYLATETELAYRPSALNLFDRLIAVTDQVRAVVDIKLSENAARAAKLPALTPGTEAQLFLAKLSAKTTDADIDASVSIAGTAEEQLADLIQEEARLKSTDPTKEKARLLAGATQIEQIADRFDDIDGTLSATQALHVETMLSTARTLRGAAELASTTSFAAQPLPGVGSETWRALWEAAESYSVTEAYPERDFPAAGASDHCVLCHQPLSSDAQDRLHRFHAFVHDKTAQKAAKAEREAKSEISKISGIAITTSKTTETLAFLATEDRKLGTRLSDALAKAEDARVRIGQRLGGESNESPVELNPVDTDQLRLLATSIRERANKINDAAFRTSLKAATDAKNELADRIELNRHADALKAEAQRLRGHAGISAARRSLSTGPMTTKSNDLARTYVTATVSDRFTRETDRLGLEQVVLGDKGGNKGKLKHKPALLGATASGASVENVLSEGQQTALGLAGLFTEIRLDESKSAVVLDDPITSLDHGRRERVARQIASLATDRQVIVFTHDLTFLGDLIKAAEEEGVQLVERCITRTGAGVPGKILEAHPWKAKDAAKRLNDLDGLLAQLKKRQGEESVEDYERLVSDWAGQLSETWERIIRGEVVNKVVDRGTTEVRPKMVRMLALITDDDNREFQAGYSQVSKWARRHDKSEEVNFTVPTHAEMKAELERAKAWLKRVKAYASKTSS